MAASGGGAAGGGSVVWMAVWFCALWFVGILPHHHHQPHLRHHAIWFCGIKFVGSILLPFNHFHQHQHLHCYHQEFIIWFVLSGFCKSLPFFYFLTFEKGRLLYIHPVGQLVGRLVDVTINYQARALRALGLLLADGTPTVGGGKTF